MQPDTFTVSLRRMFVFRNTTQSLVLATSYGVQQWCRRASPLRQECGRCTMRWTLRHPQPRLPSSVFIRSSPSSHPTSGSQPSASLAHLRMQEIAFRHMPSASTAGGDRSPMMLRSETIQSLESDHVEFSGGVCGGVVMPRVVTPVSMKPSWPGTATLKHGKSASRLLWLT
jgi:hypothetical protein